MHRVVMTIVTLAAACGPSELTTDSGAHSDARSADARRWPQPTADAAPVERCDEIDILFVIDDSASMGQEQSNLVANFPQFIDILESFLTEDGEPIDYRIGVITTGVTRSWMVESAWPGLPPSTASQSGDDGALRAGCAMTRPWIERGDPDVADTFSCVAQVGTFGPMREMPLAAIHLALTDRVSDGSNDGFLRDGALLGLVVITDEDDCSREDEGFTVSAGEDICSASEPIATYPAVLDAITGARTQWALAVIAGPGPGRCLSDLGGAEEATRLVDLADLAGANSVVSSICAGDLASALQDALARFDTTCRAIID